MARTSNEKALIPLFLVVLIDSMGFGFLFPVLTPLFLQGHAILAGTMSTGMVHFYYGLTVAMYPLMMLLGAPFLGSVSDVLGRKRVLVICLLGTGLGYLVCGLGVTLPSLLLLLLGRMISGITAATLPMAQAAVADVSTDSVKQAKYMGWMMFAIAGGQVFGPLLAGVLSDQAISPYFTNAIPFYVAAALAVFNIIWLLVTFKETYTPQVKQLDLWKTVRSYKRVVVDHRLLVMTLVFLCMQLDWSFFSQSSPAYLQKNFGYSHLSLGIFSGGLGVLIAIGGGVLTPRLARVMATRRAALLSMIALSVGTLTSVALKNQIAFWCATTVTAIGAAAAFSFIITLFSSLVDKSQQGWVMGITGGCIALAWAVTALFTGLLLSISPSLSNLLGGGFGLIGAILLLRSVDSEVHRGQ